MRRLTILISCALLLAACSSEPADETEPTVAAAPATSAATVAASTTTTSTSTTTTSTTSSTTTSVPSTTTVASTTTTTLPEFPEPLDELTHGGEVWAVVLAGSEAFDDPALDNALTVATDAGYVTGPTDCDFGAPEALGLPAGAYTVSVYFVSEADAEAAAVAFSARGVDGVVATVQTFCLD